MGARLNSYSCAGVDPSAGRGGSAYFLQVVAAVRGVCVCVCVRAECSKLMRGF